MFRGSGVVAVMLLSDVRVIDATNRFGWLAGRVLADLGAEVIKVDAPGTDRMRPEWRAFNVNKRVIDLDLTKATDGAQFEELVATADICLLTPQLDSDMQIDPDELRRRHPELIVVVVTPFGSKGPRSDWKGTDIEAMAAGGAMALAGEPTGPPVRVSEPQAYAWAGAQAAVAALIALCKRDDTGRGERADVSAQASVVTALSHAPAFVDFGGVEPTRAGAFMTGRSIKARNRFARGNETRYQPGYRDFPASAALPLRHNSVPG